ncbi:hypothetical protein GPECTOR_70g520 [Gonium pectorale]|uniref:Uncharacterized protein n=1 Tax=Gonium pectorale TaxID=33097 RepID=A0A150G334_GONPE|nr:hypothetical protein GPECTOR_70g520 [Gonium pectorale]|eukprot:KXZ44289.1 hypothetical protein GPECTOR_70g520 [Gonium pectorale]
MPPSRRPAFGVRPSQITSQISAVQRHRAATLIQAAWRGFRVRRLYLRLIVWRLRPPPQELPTGHVYRGAWQLPPIPDLPAVSLFSQLGRPSHFHARARRVYFGMERPPRSASAPGSRVPGPPLRLTVPRRAEADVPMSEVERILAGGFWRDEPPPPAEAGPGGRERRSAGEEGLSMYMRAKMKQEEREAEEALQMLAYEPHDLKHVLGSLKERTLERLGSLGRSIGGTLLGRGHGGGAAADTAAAPGACGAFTSGSGAGAAGSGITLFGSVGRLARSLPRIGGEPRLWAAGGGARHRAVGSESDPAAKKKEQDTRSFVPVPTVTGADARGDLRSMRRCLTDSLYLLVRNAAAATAATGGRTGATAAGGKSGAAASGDAGGGWGFPTAAHTGEESISDTAHRALFSSLSRSHPVYFIGNAPMAHLPARPKGNTFFLLAQAVDDPWDTKVATAGAQEYAWLTKQELLTGGYLTDARLRELVSKML